MSKPFLPIQVVHTNDLATANHVVYMSTEHGHAAKVVIEPDMMLSLTPQLDHLLYPAVDYLSRCEME